MTRILGPLPCISCGKPVSWLREKGKYRLVDAKNHAEPHRCAKEKAA